MAWPSFARSRWQNSFSTSTSTIATDTFANEFDYIACGDHLAWGYVDQPPLIPFLTHLSRAVLGNSLAAIRFIPALASSLLVVQTAVIARELGGRFYAMLVAAIAVVIAPQYLSNGSLLTTNSLEPNLWMAFAYFLILAIKRNHPRNWLWVGIFAGIGMEEKYSMALFVFGIVVGLLITDERRAFLNQWFWLGAVAMFVIFLPTCSGMFTTTGHSFSSSTMSAKKGVMWCLGQGNIFFSRHFWSIP